MNIEDFIFTPTKEDIDFINHQIEDANKRVVLTKDSIIMYTENGAPYEIELRRCETIQDVVDWIFHMKENVECMYFREHQKRGILHGLIRL